MSLDGEPSPKRARLESYSPASPPLTSDQNAFVPPQTPPPSVRMSPSWQTLSHTTSQQTSGTGSTFPTPPSTAGFQSHMAGRGIGSEAGGESGRHTPASEGEAETQRDGDGDAEMSDRRGSADGEVSMAEADHRRSDHERLEAGGDVTAAVPGTQPLYKLSTAPVAVSQPHSSQNFIEVYGLQRLQASVARRDAVTGEKINKLRKSYENKVKNLGLEGRNKAVANQGELQGLLDPGWDSAVEGTDSTLWSAKMDSLVQNNAALFDTASQNDLFSKLDGALGILSSAQLPPKEHREWQSTLGLDDASAGGKTPLTAGPAKSTVGAPSAMVKTAPAAAARSSTPASPHHAPGRPGRSGAKRRYDDSSFEGYPGYEDDGHSVGGMDDAGRRGSNAKRQKRKDFPSSSQNSPSFTSGPGSSNMVGVRSS